MPQEQNDSEQSPSVLLVALVFVFPCPLLLPEKAKVVNLVGTPILILWREDDDDDDDKFEESAKMLRGLELRRMWSTQKLHFFDGNSSWLLSLTSFLFDFFITFVLIMDFVFNSGARQYTTE